MQFQQEEGETMGIPDRVGTKAGKVQYEGSATEGYS